MGVCAFGLILVWPSIAAAYIGPGAGFALLSSFFGVLATIVLGLLSLLRWPFRVVRLAWKRRGSGRRPLGKGRVRRLIIVGFDGQDPRLTDAALKAGKLPHFAALARRGCYHRLRTTCPPVSPVAWSSFATGTNPGRHGIFDFLTRDPRTYLPLISSTRIAPASRVLRIGSYRIPLRKPDIQLLRRSRPFWSLLGDAGIWSTVLRVPITFPPDRFHGAQLSAMAAPDLLGTQGTFLLYTTRPAERGFKEGGIRIPLTFTGDRAATRITGPNNPLRAGEPPLEIPLVIIRRTDSVIVQLPDRHLTLTIGALSDWIPIAFRAAPLVKVRGLCRLQLTECGEHVSIYVTPLSLDPAHPAMPISHPSYYAPYLAARIGPFSTLGLAEDTWALNEGVIDEATFLKQTWDIDTERQRMFFAALDRLREGTLTCVFDATDRVQHMCWRHLDARTKKNGDDPIGPIGEQYRRNDAFLGEVASRLREGDLLMVISDHGFNAFRRGVNLNRWLLDHGYLALKPDRDGTREWLEDVDWSRTRAYALGLTGIFLNIAGREAHGIVKAGDEEQRVKAELIAGLTGLADGMASAIHAMFDTSVIYDGPYVEQAPDLIVGYDTGYRVSWDCASGVIAGPLIEDNVKPWSGDHCIDPALVPGVFFCSRRIARDDPALIDIAPTALALFGLDAPRHMQGRSLFSD
jgi:predicted AlkP superfamily phosphohydrolase/phosphomutase